VRYCKHYSAYSILADAEVARNVIAEGLDEMVRSPTGVRPACPIHIWEALKHGYVAVYGLKPRSRLVSVLTQGAGLNDSAGNEAIFEVPTDLKDVRPLVVRVEAVAKALSWLLGTVYKSRYSKWPEGPPRHFTQ